MPSFWKSRSLHENEHAHHAAPMPALGPGLVVAMAASVVTQLERFGVPTAVGPDGNRGRLRVAALISVEGKSVVWKMACGITPKR